MKKILKLIGALIGFVIIVVLVVIALIPWMDRWGATDAEIATSFPGDELVPSPVIFYNRAVTVNAKAEDIYPWIVQMGAERGGMYSYSWFETNILQCELINANRIHQEWQNLKVSDKVKMCPGDWGPPAYQVAIMQPNQALVMGHQENGVWGDVWQFILLPQTNGTTRLILRGRDMKSGGIWDVIHPGQFIMERGMLLGIKQRAEHFTELGGVQPPQEIAGPASHLQTVSISEFGENISLSYDSSLASQIETATIPPVALTDQILFAESHPTYAQIKFLGYQGDKSDDLPSFPVDSQLAQVMIFQTADFSGFGNDSPLGFIGQLQSLTQLIKAGVDLTHCTQPFTGVAQALPFLPWINAQQTFCAQPQIIEFSGGKGIRYLSHYAQGPSPVLDSQIFYTFQGLTNDGEFYISAVFPVKTGIFPTEPQPCSKCDDPNYDPLADRMAELTAQLTQLNALPRENFVPSLMLLDEMIQTINIKR